MYAGIPATSPKPRSSEKFLRKTQENKKILRNPVRNAFLGTKNNFLKRGITNLGMEEHEQTHLTGTGDDRKER
jgi:hypothetical protein